jgi:hypothetical protein
MYVFTMHVSVYIHVHIFMYVYIYIYTYIYIHICICTYTYIYIYIYIYVYVYVHVHIFLYMPICLHTDPCNCIHILHTYLQITFRYIMPIVTNTCTVCSNIKALYKCPKCRSVYCSIQCNKVHKSSCSSQSMLMPMSNTIGKCFHFLCSLLMPYRTSLCVLRRTCRQELFI